MAITYMGKDNFWNRKRVEANVRYEDLVELFGGSISRWGMYFSGKNMPPTTAVSNLCDLLGVEFNTGYAEFEKIHENWRATNGKRVLKTGTYERHQKQEVQPAQVEPPKAVTPLSDMLCPIVYSKLSYAEYNEFMNTLQTGNNDTILEYLYRKVDCKTFMQVTQILLDLRCKA